MAVAHGDAAMAVASGSMQVDGAAGVLGVIIDGRQVWQVVL